MKKAFSSSACLALFLFALLVASGCAPTAKAPAEAGRMLLSAEEMHGKAFFYYNRLSEEGQDAYSRIFRQIKSHPERIEIPALTKEELLEVFLAVSYDNPELLCLGSSCRLVTQGGKRYFEPSYQCGVEECTALTQAMLEKAAQVCGNVEEMTAYEKELFFHDYLVTHCAYQDGAGAWKAYTAAGALLEDEAVCEGYARAFQLLLNQAGVENYLITGSARDPEGRVEGHMWNVAVIDGEKYHVDVTWDDPAGFEQLGPSHVYFNLTDEQIAVNHLEFQPEPPGCTATRANYFVQNGLAFTRYDEQARADIVKAIERAVAEGIWRVELCFDSREEYETAVEDLIANGRVYRLLERANLSLQGSIQTTAVQYHSNEEMRVLTLALETIENEKGDPHG